MADSNQEIAAELAREEKLAATIAARFDLQPPVDLMAVTEYFADLELVEIPVKCDGVVIGLHAVKHRPLIIVNSAQPENRQRFTHAHELGHVCLGWHMGEFACGDTDVSGFETRASNDPEPEANRFAAELLLPTRWVARLIQERGTDNVEVLLSEIEVARVSAWVACIRLVRLLPARHVYALVDTFGQVLLSGQSPGTRLDPPKQGEELDRRLLDQFATNSEEIRYGNQRIVWWSFERPHGSLELAGGDARTASEVMAGLLERHVPADRRTSARNSIAGIVGVAVDEAKRTRAASVSELYAIFSSRFAKPRSLLPAALLKDEEFEVWLQKRATELAGA